MWVSIPIICIFFSFAQIWKSCRIERGVKRHLLHRLHLMAPKVQDTVCLEIIYFPTTFRHHYSALIGLEYFPGMNCIWKENSNKRVIFWLCSFSSLLVVQQDSFTGLYVTLRAETLNFGDFGFLHLTALQIHLWYTCWGHVCLMGVQLTTASEPTMWCNWFDNH